MEEHTYYSINLSMRKWPLPLREVLPISPIAVFMLRGLVTSGKGCVCMVVVVMGGGGGGGEGGRWGGQLLCLPGCRPVRQVPSEKESTLRGKNFLRMAAICFLFPDPFSEWDNIIKYDSVVSLERVLIPHKCTDCFTRGFTPCRDLLRCLKLQD